MQAVVKTPRIKLEGDQIPEEVLAFLRSHYGEVEVIRDEEEELVEITRSKWYKNIKARMTPGGNLRIYRELHNLTQEDLGQKLGGVAKQYVSNMENGSRAISKEMAKKLADIFDVSVSKFL